MARVGAATSVRGRRVGAVTDGALGFRVNRRWFRPIAVGSVYRTAHDQGGVG